VPTIVALALDPGLTVRSGTPAFILIMILFVMFRRIIRAGKWITPRQVCLAPCATAYPDLYIGGKLYDSLQDGSATI
jgi:hypothetical protein